MQQTYKNNSGRSGVSTYEIGDDFIIIEFMTRKYRFYKYTYNATGKADVEEMKRLSDIGEGLNRFIGRRKDYKYRW